jgi:hypothetical protein
LRSTAPRPYAGKGQTIATAPENKSLLLLFFRKEELSFFS